MNALEPGDCAEVLATNPEFRRAVTHDAGWYTVASRANFLRVCEAFILREIARQRLIARRHVSDGGRVTYGIEPEEWDRYLAQYWRRTDAPANGAVAFPLERDSGSDET